jgi:hypothetical protein
MLLKIFLGLILAIIVLFIFAYLRQRYVRSKQYADFLKIFGDWKSSLPTLKFGSSYGWATFKVTFKSKDDLDFASRNKLTDDFKNPY